MSSSPPAAKRARLAKDETDEKVDSATAEENAETSSKKASPVRKRPAKESDAKTIDDVVKVDVKQKPKTEDDDDDVTTAKKIKIEKPSGDEIEEVEKKEKPLAADADVKIKSEKPYEKDVAVEANEVKTGAATNDDKVNIKSEKQYGNGAAITVDEVKKEQQTAITTGDDARTSPPAVPAAGAKKVEFEFKKPEDPYNSDSDSEYEDPEELIRQLHFHAPDDDRTDIEPKHITSLDTLGPFLSKHDNWKNYDYITRIPQVCKDEPCMLGIDEAGRGPVLGPMVYGIAFCPLNSDRGVAHLKTLGCADSKALTEKDRERIFDDMCQKPFARDNIGWAIDVISPSYISGQMQSIPKVSLNEISMQSAIGLVNKAIKAGVNIAELYVDTVGPPEKYQARLQLLFPDFQVTVAKKADSTFPVVSAASICAKVTRDMALRVWKCPENMALTHEDYGSGYPGDPKTKAFLENNCDRFWAFPRIVRFSWATAQNVMNRKCVKLIFASSEEGKALAAKERATPTLKEMLTMTEVEKAHATRSQFLKDSYLSHAFEF